MTLEEDDANRLTSEYDLARAYNKIGRFTEARESIEHVIEIERRKYVGGHPNLVLSEELLSEILACQTSVDEDVS